MNDAKWMQEAKENMIRYCGEFSQMLITKADGAYIYSNDGQKILDFTSGQMCSVFGHNHPKIVAAIHKATDKSLHLLSTMLSPELVQLCMELSELLPEGLDKSMIINTGSESNEVAIRMAKLASGGFEVIGFLGSWHGMTAGAQSSTYSYTRRGYGPVIPGNLSLPAPYAYRCPIKHCKGTCDQSCLEVGISMVDKQSVGAQAAMIVEPILSAAGIIEITPEYMQELKRLCDERDIYLIFGGFF